MKLTGFFFPTMAAAAFASGTLLAEPDTPSGEWFGARSVFADRGIEFFGRYTAEVWDNTTGGLDRGTVYTGLFDFGAEIDLEKAVGWPGAKLSTTWLWLSGRDASEDLLGNLLTISNIAGYNTLRMFELWFEQNLWGDALSVRLGQLSADSEFLGSDFSGLFLNGTFGWPAVAYTNLPEGGPGYPMGTLGARVAVQPAEWFTARGAVFQGNVFSQDLNNRGTRWHFDDSVGLTWLGEIECGWNRGEEEAGLPGQIKAGVWFQSGDRADPLAEVADSVNSGYYLILDQMLYREGGVAGDPVEGGKGVEQPDRSDEGLGWFARVAFTPPDRNFVGLYADTGFCYKGLIPGRGEDALGVAFGMARFTDGGREALVAEGVSASGSEMVLECTYHAQVTPWLAVQPDIQFIIHPGGSSDTQNALVVGARASVSF